MTDTNVLFQRIGEKIGELRKHRKLTQKELAISIDINRATLSNIESGRQQLTLTLLYKIAKALEAEIYIFLPSMMELNAIQLEKENQMDMVLDKEGVGTATKNTIYELLNRKDK